MFFVLAGCKKNIAEYSNNNCSTENMDDLPSHKNETDNNTIMDNFGSSSDTENEYEAFSEYTNVSVSHDHNRSITEDSHNNSSADSKSGFLDDNSSNTNRSNSIELPDHEWN